MTRTVLCCDIGGSSLRVGLIDEEGCIIALASRKLTIPLSPDGRSEVDPIQWWDAFQDLVGTLCREHPPARGNIVGIAICGMTRTQILIDEYRSVLRPAITWQDTRAGAEAKDLAAQYPSESIDAYHPAARLAWVERSEPEIFTSTRFVLEPKDYLALKLVGRAASDRISLARLLALRSSDGLSGRFHFLLPDLIAPSHLIGKTETELPPPLDSLVACPVFMASNDTWTAALGLGALRPGMTYNIVGTSEVLGLMTEAPATAPGLVSVEWGDGLFQLGGPSQNGADVIPWLARLCGAGERDAVESLAVLLAGERHSQPLLFLPFLQGERVPYWDPDLRGAFFGLAKAHGPTDLAWAALEGAAFAARFVIETAEAAIGNPTTEIRFGGGASRNDIWCQVRADALRRNIVTGSCDEPGLLGCAAIAWTGLGRFDSLVEAQEVLARPSRRFEPRQDRVEGYDALYAVYLDAIQAATPIAHRLAMMGTAKGLATTPQSS